MFIGTEIYMGKAARLWFYEIMDVLFEPHVQRGFIWMFWDINIFD